MMDLIDRKALLEDIDEAVVFSVRPDMPNMELRGANKILDRIDVAPSVDIRTIHGKVYADGYKKGVRDFAKFLIDKSNNGTVSVMDIVDYAKEWCENNG